MFKKIKTIHLLKSIIFGFMRFLFVYILLSHSILFSQQTKKEVFAKRINSQIKIDGELNEPIWLDIKSAKDFTMLEPTNGKIERASQKTEVKFAYDDTGIYVGAYLNDKNAGYDDPNIPGILKELGPRDDDRRSTDMFGIFLNPFNDGINEFSFLVTAAGVQIDKRIILTTNGYEEDSDWDAIWESAITIKKDGWYVEMKIPYSAIRFPNIEAQEWGLNIYRKIKRLREDYSWNPINIKNKHIGQQAGLLKGIKNINPPVRLSLTPYISSIILKEPNQKYDIQYTGGIDLKYGFNYKDWNWTLDMTILPEFQQVEFDALVLNISPFETQYDEKRSFFTEGTELFRKGNLFYSRRIGSPPAQSEEDLEIQNNEEITYYPVNIKLFNASKISGRTQNGLGFGFFNAITQNTYATVADTVNNSSREILIEPITNYNMIVIDKSFNQNSFLTFINTNVNRKSNFRSAHVIGLLGSITEPKQTYACDVSLKGSFIKDENSQNGFSSSFSLYNINGNTRFRLNNYIESDQYDINDMGFLYQNNEVNTSTSIGYNIFSSDHKIAQKLKILKGEIKLSTEHQMLYKPFKESKIITKLDAWVVNTKHLWMNLKLRYFFEEKDYFEARQENQVFIKPPVLKTSISTSSDYNQQFALNLSSSLQYRFSNNYNEWEEHTNIFFYGRINPRYRINNNTFLQYIIAIEREKNQFGWIYSQDNESVFSRRRQNTITNKFILNYSFNNKLHSKIIARHYWSTINNHEYYSLDDNGYLNTINCADCENINFNTWNIDFNISWEYRAGSTLSIVWQNQLTKSDDSIEEIFFNNLNRFFENTPTNIISAKFTAYLDYFTINQGIKNKIKND